MKMIENKLTDLNQDFVWKLFVLKKYLHEV